MIDVEFFGNGSEYIVKKNRHRFMIRKMEYKGMTY